MQKCVCSINLQNYSFIPELSGVEKQSPPYHNCSDSVSGEDGKRNPRKGFYIESLGGSTQRLRMSCEDNLPFIRIAALLSLLNFLSSLTSSRKYQALFSTLLSFCLLCFVAFSFSHRGVCNCTKGQPLSSGHLQFVH